MTTSPDPLQVLVANERDERLDTITRLIESLGHTVVARALEVEQVGPLTRQLLPDVALVGIGLDSEHALTMISRIVHEAACPVIALLDTRNAEYVEEAAKRGVFAYVVLDTESSKLQSALDVTPGPFRRIQQSPGCLRAARADRAGQGDPDGSQRH